MIEYTVSFWPIFWAAVASFVFGFVFYMPAVFGKLWMKYTGINHDDPGAQKGMKKKMLSSFIASLIFAWSFAVLMISIGISTVTYAICLALIVWIGFIATITLNPVLWAGQNIKLFLLNNLQNVLMTIIVAFILFYF